MPATLALSDESIDDLDAFAAALEAVGLKAWRSTLGAARTFQGRVEGAGGWERVNLDTQLEWMRRARPFVAWQLVTGRLTATAEFLTLADLRLGLCARKHLPGVHDWFVSAARRLDATAQDTASQWNALCKIAVVSRCRPDHVDTDAFVAARAQIAEAYKRRGRPEAGRNVRAVLHRLQLTLFHATKIDSLTRPASKPSVTVSGWDPIPQLYRDNAHRYIEQVRLSLSPSTVKHIEQHLRVFGTWLAEHHGGIRSCAELERDHIEDFKIWISTTPSARTDKPLARTSVKEQLINLGCFFERTTNWGYPNAPTSPLLFAGDLPRIDRPLPRFLDDAAAAKLARATRAEPDPLTRLCVEILARTGAVMPDRRGEALVVLSDLPVSSAACWNQEARFRAGDSQPRLGQHRGCWRTSTD